MANSDKNIKITPNISQTAQPNVVFTGQGNVPITLKVLDDSFGTLSFEGSAGQLFSVNNNLSTGVIFSVNDISGIPQIDVNADGTIRLAPFGGAVQLAGMNIGLGLGSIFTNTAFGSSALAANTTGSQNTAIGYFALKVNTTALANTAVGYLALSSAVSSASYNAAFGANSLQNASSGNSNAAFGCNSLAAVTTGSANTGLGQGAGQNYTTGSNNVSIGYEGGRFQADGSTLLTTPANSIYIGVFSRGLNNSDSNSIVIGYQAIGKGANTTVLGNTSTTQTWLGGGELRLPGSTSGYVGLRGAATAGSVTYTLPAADGTAGQTLSTNGSGTLSWSSASGGITGTGTTNYLAKFTGTSSAGNSQIFDNGTNVGVGTASPNSKVTIGADFASITGMTIDTGNSTDSGLVIRKAANKPAFGVLAWDSDVLLSAGIYYDGGAWVHHKSTANNQLFSLSPGTGSTWYASNNSTGSWNVASNITLWNDAGIWKQPVQYASTADSYFSGSLGVGVTSPGVRVDVVGTGGSAVNSIGTATVRVSPAAQNTYAALELRTLNGVTYGGAGLMAINDTNYDSNLVFYTNPASSTTRAERMRITKNGDVGIGTVSPSAKLHVYSTASPQFRLEGTTDSLLSFYRNNVNGGYIGLGSAGNNDIYIYNLNSGAVRINNQAVYVTATNLVGINETSPGAQLQVTSAAAATKGLIVKAAANPTANILEVQNSSGTNLVYVDSTGDLAVGVPNATYFPSGPGAPLHVTRPTTAVATAIAAWPTYEPDTQTHARVTAFFTDGGNGGTATVATGTTNIIKFGEYYTARVVLMPEGAGGQTPADQNSGAGRDIMLLGGKSDNTAGKTGGRVFIQGGTGFAGAYGSNFGDVILQANGGRVCVGGTSPVSTSPGLDITADASNSATGQLMIKRASTNDRFRLTCGVHTSNYAFIKAYENGIGAINLALQPDVGSVGIGTTSPSDKLHVIGNVRAGNYTYGYLAMTGDLPGYANGSYPTLKSDNTIYFSADGKYSAYLGDASKNVFGLLHPTAGTANVLLNPNGTSYFTGGSVAFGATTAAGGGQVYVAPTSNATKGLVVRGAASQSANLQEWQNNGGTALAYVNSAGDIWGAGGGIFTGTGNGTDGYGESGPVIGVNKWLSYAQTSIYNNIRKLYGQRVFPATNANGDYVEIAKIPRQQVHPITLTIHASHGAVYGAAGKVYIIQCSYLIPNYAAAPLSGAATGDFDFDVEVIAIDAYSCAVRVRRHSSGTPTGAALIFTIESHNYNRGGMVELSGTGNSASALSYNSDYMRIGPTVSAPPPVGGSGAGTSLSISAANAVTTGAGGGITLRAGSAAGTGAGGSIILQPGAQATSGGNGSVRFVNPSNTGQYLTISVSSTQAVFSLTGITDAADNIQIPHNVSLPGKSLTSNAATIGSFFISGSTLRATNGTSTQFGSSNGTSTDNINYVWMRQDGHIAWYGDIGLRRDNVGTLTVTNASTGGGSLAFTNSSPSGYTVDQNNLVLTGSAFQRLSGTAARNITGIAPPSGSHVDGRMIRIYNVGSFNLTLKHNSGSSTAANRFFCVQSVDIIIAPNDYAELIYDGTNNGSGAAGWRAA